MHAHQGSCLSVVKRGVSAARPLTALIRVQSFLNQLSNMTLLLTSALGHRRPSPVDKLGPMRSADRQRLALRTMYVKQLASTGVTFR